jgi:hypothetical protein
MNDTPETAPAAPESLETEAKVAADPAREPIPRQIYVTMRLAEVGSEISEMVKEREKLTADLKAPAGEGDQKKERPMRQRRGYVALRLAILRKEQSELTAEKKALGGAQQKGGGAKKKGKGLKTAKKKSAA